MSTDLPVPAGGPLAPPSEVQLLSREVGVLSQRVVGFEARLDKAEITSANQHKENTDKLNGMLSEMRSGFAQATVASAKDAQTKWPILLQLLALISLLGLAGVGGLFVYINMSNARIETSLVTSHARLEAAQSSGLARLDAEQRNFEKEARAMVVPRDEIRIVTELRNRMLDAMEKRLDRLEAKAAQGH